MGDTSQRLHAIVGHRDFALAATISSQNLLIDDKIILHQQDARVGILRNRWRRRKAESRYRYQDLKSGTLPPLNQPYLAAQQIRQPRRY